MSGLCPACNELTERELDALMAGHRPLHVVVPSLAAVFLAGWNYGQQSAQPKIDHLSDVADRLYMELHNPLPKGFGQGPSFAELQRRRNGGKA